MEPSSKDLRSIRHTERKLRLDCILAALEADPRVTAAWMFGSFSRGTQDDLSDLDIWIVVEDEALEEIARSRHEVAAKAGKLLGFVEAEQNAPPGGAYLHAVYAGAAGLHVVDWYWQKHSAARRPGTPLLFERRPLITGEPCDLPRFPVKLNDMEDARNCATLAATMLTVIAKGFFRTGEIGADLLGFTRSLIDSAAAKTGTGVPCEAPAAHVLVDEMERLRTVIKQLRGAGVEISEEIPNQVALFLKAAGVPQ